MTDVFVIDLDDMQLAAPHLRSWLTSEERERAGRFATEQLSRRFIAARLAVRIVLGRVVGRHPSKLAFITNAWGKPELLNGPNFNLTHAGGLALLAVDSQAAVGIDMEGPTEAIAEATLSEFLSPEEADSRQREKAGSPTRLWVRKEALLKADGRGLSIDPKSLTVGWQAVDTQNWQAIAVGEERESFGLIDLDVGFDAIAALARGGGAADKVSVVPFRLE